MDPNNIQSDQQQLLLLGEVPNQPAKEHSDEGINRLYAEVYVHLETNALDLRLFSYEIPDFLQEELRIGSIVSVPFGRQPMLTGIVVKTTSQKPEFTNIRKITDILDPDPVFNAEYFEFLKTVSHYYATALHQVIPCALPSPLFQSPKKRVQLTMNGLEQAAHNQWSLSPKAHQLLQYLKSKKQGISTNYLASQLKVSNSELASQVKMLEKAGLIETLIELPNTVQPKTIKVLSVDDATQQQFSENTLKLTARQAELVEYLIQQNQPVTINEFIKELKTTAGTIKKLVAAGILIQQEVADYRNETGLFNAPKKTTPIELNAEQQQAANTVLHAKEGSEFLLYGVTGSGKTEVYIKLTEAVIQSGKPVLIMVPEISLTSQIAQRFIDYFGIEKVCLWHSQLNAGERADTWRRMVKGEVPIIIGARSAVWMPSTNFGLIVIDEEHDNSYKQDSPVPRYNARHLSEERIKRFGGKLVLGSATPDIETYTRHLQNNTVLMLNTRYGERPLADVTVVDMKKERHDGNRSLISRTLEAVLQENLNKQEQAIILMNRRGFYTTVTCGYCQHIFQCPSCDVSVTVHKSSNTVQCHYCGYRDWTPECCPQCASSTVITSGVGTQRVEEELTKKLPEARLLRLDSDVLKTRHAAREVIEKFKNHEADILIGTQMIAKGLDIPNVTLVGVLSADSTFSLPDFKSAERGFQLMTQVAGRAGRGDKAGRVIVQAISPEHPVIAQASKQDYLAFYEEESKLRETLWFPPYSQLFRFIVSCESDKSAWQFIQATAEHMKQSITEAGLSNDMALSGPASCVIGRIQGRYRYHLLVKSKAGQIGHDLINQFFTQVKSPEGIHFLLDHDAQTLL